MKQDSKLYKYSVKSLLYVHSGATNDFNICSGILCLFILLFTLQNYTKTQKKINITLARSPHIGRNGNIFTQICILFLISTLI